MTSLAQTLKQYFDIAIETDPALKAVYDEKKLDECGQYINNRARKLATNNMAMVESSVVFKWARDFFYGDMEDENAKPEIDKGAEKRIKDEIEVEARDATVIKQKKPKKQTKAEANGWELFQGSLFDDLPPEEQGHSSRWISVSAYPYLSSSFRTLNGVCWIQP